MGYNPNYQTEAHIYGKDILKTKPDGKIAILYQNDGFGKDYLIGLKAELGDHAGMIVKEASYETSEPTVDSQVVTLQGSGADIFIIGATPKFAAQAIRKSADLGWNATRYLSNVSPSIATVLKPAGLEKSKGLITAYYGKDPTDARWKDAPDLKAWQAFCDKYMSQKEFVDANATYAFAAASTMVEVLKQCGADLSRDNVMKQAASIKDFVPPMVLPGMKISTSPTNFSPIRQMQLAKFDGQSWQLFGDLLMG
jgi:branched-chain amino acid transport system substrate-binding protein